MWRSNLFFVVAVCLSLTTTSQAATSTRFLSYFRNSAKTFLPLSQDTCADSLLAFQEAYSNASDHLNIDFGIRTTASEYVISLCQAHASCMLDNASSFIVSEIGTAGIVLGLLPTLLAVLSPSIAEIALLSVHRPVLALLASVGSPGVLQTRVFEYIDPAEMIEMPTEQHESGLRLPLILGPWRNSWKSKLIVMAEYFVIACCIINTQWLTVQLGRNSILLWGCTGTVWPPLIWSLFPFFMDGIASLGYRMTLENGGVQASKPDPGLPHSQSELHDKSLPIGQAVDEPSKQITAVDSEMRRISDVHIGPSPNHEKRSFMEAFRDFISGETTLSACHPIALVSRIRTRKVRSRRVKTGVLLQCTSGFLSFFHLLYGTITFSSLLFIAVSDAAGEIAMRFLISGLACRLIILFEIAGMRGNVKAKKGM